MRSHRPAPTPPRPQEITPGIAEARAARRESTDALLEVIEQGPGVRHLVDQVHEHGRRNHFLDLLNTTLGRAPS